MVLNFTRYNLHFDLFDWENNVVIIVQQFNIGYVINNIH